ncbi:disease resistance protein Pik-2-like [Panicum virgatum]|uniref:disease resistance protein Pik-2-like n=1 Tax=Panicum virgatum TaxID=38727 RepID=UPI0019D60F0E|nr:disease resistance protein Pik-2-like [Panicum virgatum]
MAGAMLLVCATTGATSSTAVAKLTDLLGGERGKLLLGGVQDELGGMDALLQRLAGIEDEGGQLGAKAREWRREVRELGYDVEDCVDMFTQALARRGGGAAAGFVRRKTVRGMVLWWESSKVAGEVHELRVLEEGTAVSATALTVRNACNL